MASTLSDQERIALQRRTVKEHMEAENTHEYDRVNATFVQADRAYYQVVPGGIQYDGIHGVESFYELLDKVLPDLEWKVTHEYDVPGCSICEGTASGTHSAEFAGVPASGNFVSFEVCALYIFDEAEPDKLIAERNAFEGYWMVSRAEDVRSCAQDYETFTNTLGFEPNRSNEEGGLKLYPLEIDRPYHTRWRSALGPYFSPRAIRSREANIRQQADYLIDTFIEQGSCEFIDEFAAQLPGRVFFGSFLGVPFSELNAIQKATDTAMRGAASERAAAWGTVAEFLTSYLKSRESEPPRGDFVDTVLAGVTADDGEPCPWNHKLFVMIDMMADGLGTTSHVLASIAHHLATHPGDRERVLRDPGLRPSLVEEVIRVYAPIVAVGRTATRDTEIAGQPIKKGDFVMLSQAAASRDPRLVEEPRRVNLDRPAPVNLAFSYGPHRCIGAHVGRLQARVALEEILRRIPDFAIPDGYTPIYSNSSVARNMDELKLAFTPGRREGNGT